MYKSLICVSLIAVGLFSCIRHKAPPDTDKVKDEKATIAKLTSMEYSYTVTFGTSFPTDTVFKVRILTPGGPYHNGEVDPRSSALAWKVIFKTDSGYCIDDTKVKLSRVNDPILDTDGKKTGWLVEPQVKDSAILLISGVDNLPNHSFKAIKLSKTNILPNEPQSFDFNGVNYKLYATGNQSINEGMISNYSLFIDATMNGKTYHQVLVSGKALEYEPLILFIGDIDADGILDFIVDTSCEENLVRPTLYLSKPAKAGNLLEVTGMISMVGC